MTVVETLLVFVGVPLAIIAVLALLTLVPGRRKRPRYRPGQAWEHEPVWYEPQPEHPEPADHGGGHAALGASAAPPALTAGTAVPAAGGPRGGARGTW